MLRLFFTRQFLSFLLVGGGAAVLHWLARFGLSEFMPFAWAVVFAYLIGMAAAFVLNSIFVFPSSTKPRAAQARDFALVNILFLPVVLLVSVGLSAGLKHLGLKHHAEELAHALAIPVPMLATFLIYKFFAFAETKS